MKNTIKLFLALAFLLGLLTSYLPAPKVSALPDCSAGASINIIAHPDDDLLFINPKIQQDVDASKCVETVFLTSGDGGAGLAHASNREDAIRAAYADMANEANSWTTGGMSVGGHTLQHSVLDGDDRISLVFLRLPDGVSHGGGTATEDYQSLAKLWFPDASGAITTINPIDGTTGYTKEQLISVLHSLMAAFTPDTIRSLNFSEAYDVDDTHSNHDHSDHRVSAYFTKEAHERYTLTHQLKSYRGYDIYGLSDNLTDPDLTKKRNIFYAYNALDGGGCTSTSNCTIPEYPEYLKRTYEIATHTRTSQSFTTMDGSSASLGGVSGTIGKLPATTTFNGSIYTFYYDQTNGELRYAKASSSVNPVWTFGVVDSYGTNVGQYPTTAVYNNRLYVFYYDAANTSLRVADTDGSTWSYSNIDTAGNTGLMPTAIEYGGYLRVFYYDATNGNLKQAHLSGSTWYYTTIEGDSGAVINGSSPYADSTCYGDVGIDPVVLEYNGSLQIFSYDATNGNMHHTWYDGSNWNCEALDGNSSSNGKVNANVGLNPTVVNYGGVLQLFYRDATNGNLRHAWHDSSGWHFEDLDGEETISGIPAVTRHEGDVGATPHAVVHGDTLHVFASDVSKGDLRHYWSSSAQGWQAEVFDGSGDDGTAGRTNNTTGEDPTAVVYGAKLHVFYYESSDTNLRHANF